jgi:hypothetical protein
MRTMSLAAKILFVAAILTHLAPILFLILIAIAVALPVLLAPSG